MSKHLLKVNENKRVIASKTVTKSFEIDKSSSSVKTKIKRVTIYDEDKMNKFALSSYSKKHTKVLSIIRDLLSSDDATETDFILAIDELARLISILEGKYKEFLKKEEYKKFVDDIFMARSILNNKIIEYQNELLYNEERGR